MSLKIQIASDLHFEFGESNRTPKNVIHQLKKANADVLVLAGDITTRKEIFETLRQFSENFNSVVYVTGNHEHYGTHIDKIREIRNDVLDSFSNVHWLDNSSCEISGQRFIGCTLWFPYDPMNQLYEKFMNDFQSIHEFQNWVYKENDYSVKYLSRSIDSESIVITHHLPSYKCVHEKYKYSELNRFFVCDLSKLLKENSPKLFISGHTHKSYDFLINSTRMMCNPLGYPNENDKNEFDWNKIINL